MAKLEKLKMTLRKNSYALALALMLVAVMPSSKALACGACTNCGAWSNMVNTAMNNHQNWMINEWWTRYVLPAMQQYTDQVRNAVVTDAMMIGAFLDGESELNALRAVGELNAETMKDYTTSDSICKFGTLSRSLAASQGRSKATQLVLSQRSLNRQLGQKKMTSAEGSTQDRIARYKQFVSLFCDAQDYGTAMGEICVGTPPDTMRNLDINYTRLIDAKKTLDVNFTTASATATNDEKAVIALENNLYAHDVLDRIDPDALQSTDDSGARTAYLDQRSIVAKRSVAENSFDVIVGQKAQGSGASSTYMVNVLKKLGLSTTDAQKYLGNNPSYDAQMEVLTKKLYQDPTFYANLYDTPANVERQYAALQSFGLMQRRDIFETIVRSEMLLSMILEMEISKYQDDIQNRQNR